MTTATMSLDRWTDRNGWSRFVDHSAQGSVFCRPELLDALDVEWEVRILGSASAPRAAAIVCRDGSGRVQRLPLPFCLYQGILLPGEHRSWPAHRAVHETIDAVSELVAALQVNERMSWCLHPSFSDVRALSWLNHDDPTSGQFRIDVRYTGLIDIERGLDDVLANARSVRRQEFKKAGARFTVERSIDLDLLDSLHGKTFARQGLERSNRERALLRSIAAAALAGDFGELLVARDLDGTAAGAVLFLFDATTAYYLVAANDPDFRSSGVSTLLFLSGAARGIERGARRVDVIGMNSPSRGDFKASFGALPVPYYVVNWERP